MAICWSYAGHTPAAAYAGHAPVAAALQATPLAAPQAAIFSVPKATVQLVAPPFQKTSAQTVHQIEPLGRRNLQVVPGSGRSVVFLDVDGVINVASQQPPHLPELQPHTMAALARVLRSTGADVVLSSTWRCSPTSIGKVNAALSRYGLRPILDCTPFDPRCITPREDEIISWLEAHQGEVSHWVVLDDVDLTTSGKPNGQRVAGHFVHTDACKGLTEKDADRAIHLMGLPVA